ncbi:flagellar basal body rod protein FlgF [Paucibacter sp. R3-3]|uniref:Flagellar basal-body rod protein FlgF n=1 Tax=Roseateles agri TaxID=3098619 RepID=A0ABU5DQ69_9BURK|nr:flagellar basal body rod protein FlgF [Paucibacter sp. R3-3]MDY0747419.1 flagellar basal body rod protein FlgF [Paucibacter sp. R3-3]
MDALIYTVMSGAERAMRAQQVHANNLANLETGGFRANLEMAGTQAVKGYGYAARHMSELQADAVSAKPGVQTTTGRDLDVAIQGDGLFAVEDPNGDGGEAYTRSGNFTTDADGRLLLGGRAVMGDGGAVTLPPEHTAVVVGADGSISVQVPGQTDMQVVDKLKLVKPSMSEMTKNAAGLLVSRDGGTLSADASVQVKGGHLEGSNVSAVEEMVATMSLNRDFEVQMKLLNKADSMADAGNRLIRE